MKSIIKICLALILVCAIIIPAIAQEKEPMEIKPGQVTRVKLPDLIAVHTTTLPIGGDIPFSPGQTITFKVTVKNIGEGMAKGSVPGPDGYVIDLSFSREGIRGPASPRVVPSPYNFREGMLLKGGRISSTDDLAPSASREYTASVELPKDIKPGRYWIGISVDPFNKVAEGAGEGNNVTNHGITIK